jgi:hypothetical protein
MKIFLLIALTLCITVKLSAQEKSKRLISKIIPFFMVADSHPAKSDLHRSRSFDRSTLYSSKPSKRLYPVIQIGADAAELEVQSLCLATINDAYYNTTELMEIIKGGRRCFVVLMYREAMESGKVDIYHPEGYGIEPGDYNKMFNEVKMFPCRIDAQMELTARGLDMELSLTDKYNRRHQYIIKENRSKNDLFGMIAPVGSSIKIPEHFPLIYMKQFNFVNRKGTDFRITIDEKLIKPKNFFPLVNFHRVYFTRYSFNVVTRSWNPNYCGVLNAVDASNEIIHTANSEYRLENNDGYMEVRSVTSTLNGKEMKIIFYPALPDFEALRDTDGLDGYFAFNSGEMNDILGGTYRITKSGEQAVMTMNPIDGYSPIPGKPWMTAYRWTGTIQFGDDVQFTGKWEKIRLFP